MHRKLLLALAVGLCVPTVADTEARLEELASSRTLWPTTKWEKAVDKNKLGSKACRKFISFLTLESKDKNRPTPTKPEEEALRTDGLVVVYKGKIVYSYYDDAAYKPTTPHCLWSSSKSVNAALVGVAEQDGKITLKDRLETYFPAGARKTKGPNEHFYRNVILGDLLSMSSNFKWNESYDGDPATSSITHMLYQSGYDDTAAYALKQHQLPSGPGERWVYSSGNVSILQAVLKKAYGKQYDSFPWERLFKRIGMNSVVFERDEAGTFIGSSYVFASPEDMARFGFLYLNAGKWGGAKGTEQILSPEVARLAYKLAPALEAKDTDRQYILDEGVYSLGGFWLNAPLPAKDLPLPFPKSPKDMFFAGGHYGQLVILLPTEDMIIARTGHDSEYWSKIDKITQLAIACFDH